MCVIILYLTPLLIYQIFVLAGWAASLFDPISPTWVEIFKLMLVCLLTIGGLVSWLYLRQRHNPSRRWLKVAN